MRAPRAGMIPLLAALAAFPVSAQRSPADPARLGLSPDRLQRIDKVMQQYVDSGQIAGAVTVVLRHGRVAHAGVYGWADREGGRRMTRDALFRIASQTKAITSVAVMMLVEEGKLRLGSRVSEWLPSFADAKVATRSDTGMVLTPLRRPISIRDLLTHTAGISYGGDSLVRDRYAAEGLGPEAGFGWYFADKAEPICASMDRLGTLPFVAQPRERFVYGYNTDILGCVVERVSGLPLDRFFEERIFKPLGMQSTWFFPPEATRDRLTAVYVSDSGELKRAEEGARGQGSYLEGPRTSFSGGAGLVSSADDYARFLQMLLNGGTLNGRRLLAPATVALMTTDQIDTIYRAPGRRFGLGFEVLEDPGIAGTYGYPGRYAWGGAYATNYWVDPELDLVGVFMIQLFPGPGFDLAERFRTLVYQAVVDAPSRFTAPP